MPDPEHILILVVEDEALVRIHGCGVLESAGFEVIEAEVADEAVGLLERHDDNKPAQIAERTVDFRRSLVVHPSARDIADIQPLA